LKDKQPTTKVLVICLSASNFPTFAFSVGFLELKKGFNQSSMSPSEVNKTQAYESKRKFQVSWATKLPWAKLQ
jgi:hypothetical protein